MKETSYDVISDTIIPRQIDAVITTRIHLQSDIDFTKFLSSQTRVAATFFDNYKGKQNGWMMYQELTWRFLKAPLRLSARYAIFNTDSYDTRIYAYEKDVLYAFSIPALYSTGSRYYLVATWKPARNISVYAKWSQTIWSNVYELSSGNDRIEGNTRSQFTLKMKVNF
jgi:outer membrane receptor protein involved in Fe transport